MELRSNSNLRAAYQKGSKANVSPQHWRVTSPNSRTQSTPESTKGI